MRSFVVLCGI